MPFHRLPELHAELERCLGYSPPTLGCVEFQHRFIAALARGPETFEGISEVAPGIADRFVIECKVLHNSLEGAVREGLRQTAEYMDRCGSGPGHLVIFDRSAGMRWEDKTFRRDEFPSERDARFRRPVAGLRP